MITRNCIVFLFFVLFACAFPVSAQNQYWQQQQMMRQQQQMQQQQMMRQQEMMRQQQMEQMRRQQMQQQQQQRTLQQQRARQSSEQARAAQDKAIRDQSTRRQLSQRRNMTQKLQQQKALEQNNRTNVQRRLTQQRLVQQKNLQKNRQAQEQKNRDIGALALIGSISRTSMSPQLSERIRNLTQKSVNDNNRTKVTASIKKKLAVSKNNTVENTGKINRPSGKKAGSSGGSSSGVGDDCGGGSSSGGDSERPSLTKVFNQSAKPLSKDIALRLMTLDAAKKGAGTIIRDKQKMKDRLFLIKKNKEERRLANLRKAENERLDKERSSVVNGTTVYRRGTFSDDSVDWEGNIIKGMEWAIENPITSPDYAKKYGLPAENTGKPDWVVKGKTNGAYSTRKAPASHNNQENTGGGTEILPKNPEDVKLDWFHMPDK